ncbi:MULTISPECIES: hypothetical protein [Anaerococcus]|jgi:hypothetical protein|uniref:hypothetical protein n=1 Tax=Anaerococcus TaxID=165779 RepID=UPI00290414A2|nr:hypothetical protein [Anaerococcus sp.]MDU2598246.1 hypothetical protein [Anaerococcus sp.]
MDELRQKGVKFTEDDVVMVAKTQTDDLAWLEKGNETAGLEHIINRHGDQFLQKGITAESMPSFLKTAIENGIIVGNQGRFHSQPRVIYEVEYNGEMIEVAITISDNGYIVGANPK